MHRTNNHVTRYHCKDVAFSFARMRAELMANAAQKGMTILLDDGEQFRAEQIDSCRQRVVYMACAKGAPFVNGPAIIRSYGAQEYVELFLQK